jgi:hypothetical protein
MNESPEIRRPARDRLGHELLAAAVRQHELRERGTRRRRRRNRGIVALLAVVLGTSAVAGASRLIGVGEPVKDRRDAGHDYRPGPNAPDLVAKVTDPAGERSWGVGIYTGVNGADCVTAGAVRGIALGLLENGRFRPYPRTYAGACGDMKRLKLMTELLVAESPQGPRTLAFGRVREPGQTVIAEHDGREFRAQSARGGGFLFVFEGRLRVEDLSIRLQKRAS